MEPEEYLEAVRLERQLQVDGLLGPTDSEHHDKIRQTIRKLYVTVATREDIFHIPSKCKAAIWIGYFLGGPRDSVLHKKLLDEAADQGDVHALAMRAENFWFGENGYAQDISACERDALKAHEGGYWGGSSVLAWVMRKKAADLSDPTYEEKAQQIFRESFPKLLEDAKHGDNIAQDWLAWRYNNGEGVAKDANCGSAWFRISADNGLPWAMHWLGLRYLEGDGVIKNVAIGKHWLQKAVNHGVEESLNVLKTLSLCDDIKTTLDKYSAIIGKDD